MQFDCSKGGEPDLRGYDHTVHDAIFFDECTPQQVISQKMLFMGGPWWVKMASSSTNCHAYDVCVYKKRLVLANNKWSKQLRELDEEDEDWARKNSVHVRRTTPLWQS